MQNRYEPVELSTPAFHLNGEAIAKPIPSHPDAFSGHKSIVNNALIHPNYLHIVTSGVERHVILHGVSSSSPCTSDLALTELQVRELPDGTPEELENYLRAMTGTYPLVVDEDEQSGDEFDTIPLFDQSVVPQLDFSFLQYSCAIRILRQEGRTDVFDVRRYNTDSEDSGDDDSDEDSNT